MFTSKSIALLFAIFILIAIAWNTDITMIYIFFAIAFVMFALSFVHMQLSMPGIDVKRNISETAFEGEMLNVKIEVQNKRGLGAYFFELIDIFPFEEEEKKKMSLFILNIKGNETRTFNYAVNCNKRGLWKVGPLTVISQDSLGFFKIRKELHIFSDILIYPNLFRLFAFPELNRGSVSWLGVETAKISGDSHEFFGIREYQRGDAISRIHWPSTARHQELIVKQFERNAVQEATILLDLKKGHDIGAGKETTLEYAVKIAGSVARHLLNSGVLVQMVAYGEEAIMLPFGKGEAHMYTILEYLARVRAESSFSLSQTLDEVSFIVPYHSTLITIMLDNDMDGLTSLVQFKVKGIKLIVIVLSSSTFGHIEDGQYLDVEEARRFDEALAGLEAYVYRIAKGDDLEKKFETV